jgi:GntR family transcriptional regulator, transcriptional repressor for pyruvate dehydrogenase complex
LSGSSFVPIQPTRASTEVIAQIREAIFSGVYRSGDRLPTERDMAAQFKVSRVTVRDALRVLEASGLVTVRVGGHGGPFVAMPDASVISASLGSQLQLQGTTFEELAEARLAIETTAARLAAERATAQDLAVLRASIEGTGRHDNSAAESLDFHYGLVKAAHNRVLLLMFEATRALIRSAFGELHREQPDMAGSGRSMHTALFEAIESRDADSAVRLMRDHLYEFAERAARRHARERAGPEVPATRSTSGRRKSEAIRRRA